MHPLNVGLTALGIGAAGLVYAAGYEVRAFRLRRFDVPLLPPGTAPLRILQVSDLHMTPGQRRKQRWVQELAALEPDLVVNTGDNLAHHEAVPAVLDALGPLLDRPGAFVPGSNDYYGPVPKNPARYLWERRGSVPPGAYPLPWEDLQKGLAGAGWADLTNARAELVIDGRRIELVGVDDPHIGRDRYDQVAGRPNPAAELTLGIAHAPYRRVLDRMINDECALVIAGHTHGGQLCVPFYGALVTNCDLPRRHAKGLTWYQDRDGATAGGWLHVSAGLGTSPYAPVRFACPPEATLLTLVPRPVSVEPESS